MNRFFALAATGLLIGLFGQSIPQQLSAQDSQTLPAFLSVKVPADAIVEVDGVVLKSTGPLRRLRTPFLAPGAKYPYTFKATFVHEGKKLVLEKLVLVEPGKEIEIDFLPVEAPKKKEEPKKEEPKKEIPKKEEPKKEVHLDVPYVPTPQPVVDAMLKLAEVHEGDVVYDLGCGDGRIVITAVKKFKAKKGLGLELAPERVKLSKENAKKAEVDAKVEIREGSVLDLKTVAEADVVTLYLFPEINLKLMPMLKKTLKPGARIVSHDFSMGDWKADTEFNVKVPGDRDHTLYLWVIPDPSKKKDLPKVEEPKKEIKKEVPKIEEPKKEEPKKEIPKKTPGDEIPMPKVVEPKKETIKKDLPKVDEPKKDLPKVEIPKKDLTKVDEPKKDLPKVEIPKKDTPKTDLPKVDEPKKDLPKVEIPKDLPKKDLPKVDEPKKDLPKVEIPKKEEPKPPAVDTIKVPYVPTPQVVVDKMLELAQVKEGDVVWDLGCGDGRIVVTAVKKYKAKKGFGLDLDTDRVKDSVANAKRADILDKVEFKQGDVLGVKDVSEADVVTLYLLPEVNLKLMPILKKTLKPGARVVSHDFDMGDDWKPEKTIQVMDEGFEHTIYLWTIPAKK